MSRLTVCLLTYNRLKYAVQTLESTLKNLRFSGDLNVHIADDGSDDGDYVRELVNVAKRFGVKCISATVTGHKGYGANYNLAMQVVHERSDFVLPLEDDWELIRELDVDTILKAMVELGAGCVRLGYLGWTQPLKATFKYAQDCKWLELDPDSEEPHVFAGHPRIETVEWERKLGPWTEGLLPGATEFELTYRRESREGVYWPVDMVKPAGDMFVHIGTIRSY